MIKDDDSDEEEDGGRSGCEWFLSVFRASRRLVSKGRKLTLFACFFFRFIALCSLGECESNLKEEMISIPLRRPFVFFDEVLVLFFSFCLAHCSIVS